MLSLSSRLWAAAPTHRNRASTHLQPSGQPQALPTSPPARPSPQRAEKTKRVLLEDRKALTRKPESCACLALPCLTLPGLRPPFTSLFRQITVPHPLTSHPQHELGSVWAPHSWYAWTPKGMDCQFRGSRSHMSETIALGISEFECLKRGWIPWPYDTCGVNTPSAWHPELSLKGGFYFGGLR